ncbi:hypothetical protein [Silanimonas algicola]
MTRTLDNTPINRGLDFERAIEILAGRYGEVFQSYMQAKRAGEPTESWADHLRSIQRTRKALRVDDSATISAILAGELHPSMDRAPLSGSAIP